MGSWGSGTFENDTASDWVYRIVGPDASMLVRSALTLEGDYIEAPDAEEALAACEVVAAALGQRSSDLPDPLVEWVTQYGMSVTALRDLSLRALSRIELESELSELFAQSGALDELTATITDLRARLRA